MSSAHGLRQVGYFELPGRPARSSFAGTTAFIGHMRAPAGTSIVDIADPAHPRLVARARDAARHPFAQGAHARWVDADQSGERNGADKNAPPENFSRRARHL